MVSFFSSNSNIYYTFHCSSESADSGLSWCFASLVCFSLKLDTSHQLIGTDTNMYSLSRYMWTCLEFRVLLKLTVALDPSGILKTFFVMSTHQAPTHRKSVSCYSLSWDPMMFYWHCRVECEGTGDENCIFWLKSQCPI